MLKIKN